MTRRHIYFDILTLFPEAFESVLGSSILKRAASPVAAPTQDDPDAVRPPVATFQLHDIRGFSQDRHGKVDRAPYGGGPGMVMQCQPVWDAAEHAAKQGPQTPITRIFMTPAGRRLDQALAEELATKPRLMLLCGHYEGIDQRVIDALAEPSGPESGSVVRPDEDTEDEPVHSASEFLEVSIGDYVLTGGEVAAMVLIDAVVRLLPGALGDDRSSEAESFSKSEGSRVQKLDFPHYTRPAVWHQREVPSVLLSGDHTKIDAWRDEQATALTRARRPDLLMPNAADGIATVIRTATESDRDAIDELLKSSFPTDAEARLVRVLRAQDRLRLALVAELEVEDEPQVVGFASISDVRIGESEADSVVRGESRSNFGLAPVAVAPEYQRRGIGQALCRQIIRQAKQLAEDAGEPGFLVVLGEPGFYNRLGFTPASDHGLTSSFATDPAQSDAFQAMPICLVRDTPMPAGAVTFEDAFADLG